MIINQVTRKCWFLVTISYAICLRRLTAFAPLLGCSPGRDGPGRAIRLPQILAHMTLLVLFATATRAGIITPNLR